MYLYRTEWTEYDEKNLIPDSRLDLCDGGKGTAGLFFYSLFIGGRIVPEYGYGYPAGLQREYVVCHLEWFE